MPIRWAVIAAAVAGAALGSKLLFWLEDPQLTWHHLHDPAYLMGGKTIVGALIFGLVFVELMKRYIGVRQSTGDLYAIPLALGIAIGRIGCFLTGLSDNTYGTPTTLPWAVNFGDGVPRHPTQLYEIAFLVALIPVLYRIVILSGAEVSRSETSAESKDPYKHYRHFLPGDAFKIFMVAYLTFRLLCDFIKPYPRIFLGLGGIQWPCLLILLYYSPDIARWLRSLGDPLCSPVRLCGKDSGQHGATTLSFASALAEIQRSSQSCCTIFAAPSSRSNVPEKATMRMLATGVLGLVVAVAGLVCLLSSMCTVTGGFSSGDRTGFAVLALISLAIAVGGAMLIARINRKS